MCNDSYSALLWILSLVNLCVILILVYETSIAVHSDCPCNTFEQNITVAIVKRKHGEKISNKISDFNVSKNISFGKRNDQVLFFNLDVATTFCGHQHFIDLPWWYINTGRISLIPITISCNMLMKPQRNIFLMSVKKELM